ncbi:MAG: RNB domain-containing ribonuclease [Desulfurivibrionaceae bacterium]
MSFSGKIVEYIEHGKFICGLVIGEEAKRLRLINQNGREIKLAMARVLHQTDRPVNGGASREDVQLFLQEVNQRRQELTDQVDLAEIWELASEEQENAFKPEFLAGLCFGEDASEEQVAAFLRTIFSDRLFFKYREGLIQVHPPEVVEQLKRKAEKEREKEALLNRGAEALARLRRGEEPGEWPEREKCLALVRDYYLFGNDFEESDLARELLKAARLNGPYEPYHLLVQAGIWAPDQNIPVLRYEIPNEFSEEVLREASACIEPDLAELTAEGYRDLTALSLLTIDGAMTRDYDDALHLEKKGDNYLVGIHITDVSRYVKPGTLLFEEARKRCTSLYFPDGQIPMLPEHLSEGVGSLIEGKVRPATSIMVELTPAGEVVDSRIVPSVVKVRRQLSYSEANRLRDTDEELRILDKLGKTLHANRVRGGALIMPFPDVIIDIGEEGRVDVRLDDGNSGSRAMIAEFMVLANTLAASYVADREVPGLFRGQEEPQKRLFEGFNRDLLLNLRQRRFLRPAKLTIRANPHSCVGVMQYTTVTSPIRRFLDLVMQTQIMSLARGRGAAFQDHELNGFAADITKTQSRANLVKRLRFRYWLLRYLEPLVGERVEAMIIDKGKKRVSVLLTDLLMESDLPPSQGGDAEPGDIVKVKIAKVGPLDDLLRLEW